MNTETKTCRNIEAAWTKRRAYLLGSSILLLLVCSPSLAQDTMAEMVKKADIIFSGKVVQVGSTTMVGVPQSDDLVDIEVTDVIERPASIAVGVGNVVTVKAKTAGSFAVDANVTIFAQGWIVGDRVAVLEISHTTHPEVAAARGGDDAERAEIAQARAAADTEALRARVNQARAVVVGRVVSVTMATATSRGGPDIISEHNPDWREALIEVEETIRGEVDNEEIVIRFPASEDVAWYGVPRLTVGQEGTFILDEDTISDSMPLTSSRGDELPAFTAMQSTDVLPRKDADRIRELIGN